LSKPGFFPGLLKENADFELLVTLFETVSELSILLFSFTDVSLKVTMGQFSRFQWASSLTG